VTRKSKYTLNISTRKVEGSGVFRGGCDSLLACTDHQVILSGPADTGKTWAACWKSHLLLMFNPKCQGALMRKTYASMPGSVCVTFGRVVEDAVKTGGVRVLGDSKPDRYIYSNGSVLWVGGLDKSERVLSSERDFVQVNQAEELKEADWETVMTRCSGRAAVLKHPQIFGDCNPGPQNHWIRARAVRGSLTLLCSTHRDNPTIYEEVPGAEVPRRFPQGPPDGTLWQDGVAYVLTERGRRRLAVLDELTGVRRKRLRDGVWATAEGAVYDMFDGTAGGPHVKVRQLSEMKRFMLCQDDGYTNPAVVLLVGEDPDGRWHVFKEFYRRGVLQADVVAVAAGWFREYKCFVDAVDAAAASLVAALNNAGVNAQGAKGRVLGGIQAVQNMLKVQKDGLPRLTFDPACVNTVNEFESYVWKPDKDEPVKDNDHSCDALRYLADAMGVPTGGFAGSGDFYGGGRSSGGERFGADRIEVERISSDQF
jgi:phage terminase large subunit